MRPQINLIDPSLRPKAERLSSKTAALLLMLATGLLGAHYSYERYQLGQTLALARAQDASNAANPAPAPGDADAAFQASMSSVIRDELLRDGLSKLTDLPTDNAKLLANVITALPASLWLKEVQFVGKGGLRIVGGATDPSALAEYSDRLSKVPALQGLPVQVITLEPQASTEDDGAAAPASAPEPRAPLPKYYHFVLATAAAQGATP
ncbi:MAG: PilN domain-containing protein [Burkholderiales bacterium]|nr:PilN domain-containing protein [Burkholderiales bacterium]